MRLTISLALALLLNATEVYDVTVSDRFPRFIEGREGFKAKAYKDIKGNLTIGYGHLIRSTEPELQTKVLTRDDANELLKQDVASAEAAVNRLVQVPLKQEQFDALVSFVYNVGAGAFAQSTLLRKLNKGHCCAVPQEMRRWNNGGQAGMIARRNAEIDLYTGDS